MDQETVTIFHGMTDQRARSVSQKMMHRRMLPGHEVETYPWIGPQEKSERGKQEKRKQQERRKELKEQAKVKKN